MPSKCCTKVSKKVITLSIEKTKYFFLELSNIIYNSLKFRFLPKNYVLQTLVSVEHNLNK